MTAKNDGGPAFPFVHRMPNIPPYDPAHPDKLYVTRDMEVLYLGVSVRDYFAAKAVVSDEIGVRYAEQLLGRPMPDYAADPLANAIFWADARARLRYIEADAMLAAREAA